MVTNCSQYLSALDTAAADCFGMHAATTATALYKTAKKPVAGGGAIVAPATIVRTPAFQASVTVVGAGRANQAAAGRAGRAAVGSGGGPTGLPPLARTYLIAVSEHRDEWECGNRHIKVRWGEDKGIHPDKSPRDTLQCRQRDMRRHHQHCSHASTCSGARVGQLVEGGLRQREGWEGVIAIPPDRQGQGIHARRIRVNTRGDVA